MKEWRASPRNTLHVLYSADKTPAIIPAKTPLRAGRDSLAAIVEKCPHDIRSVVDLTNTQKSRYPVPRGIRRVHLKMEGHGKVPDERAVETFLRIVEDLRAQRGGTVLVHCTHGLNRTGYLCCRWLMAAGGVRTPSAAMSIFAKVRGGGIAREVLCTALRRLPAGIKGVEPRPTPSGNTTSGGDALSPDSR